MTERTSFLAELKRRNVIRMAGLYLVAAWLVTQVAGTLLPMFEAPAWVARTVVVLLALGFVPTLIFSWVFELTPEGVKRESEVPPDASIRNATSRRIDFAIIAVLLAALGYFALDKFVLGPREAARVAAVAPAPAPAPQARTIRSIAVLPLDNYSGDPDQDYFAEGMTDELTADLAIISKLRVISRGSTTQFRGKARPPTPEIAKLLDVDAVIEGSVRRVGDDVRLTVQLIDGRRDEHLWAETYDRAFEDALQLQKTVALRVVSELGAKLSSRERRGVELSSPSVPEAYERYLRGLALYNEEGEPFEIERLLTEALEAEPGFALAYALRSKVRIQMFRDAPGKPEEAPVARLAAGARADFERALALQPDLPAALVARGLYQLWIGPADADLNRPLEDLTRALEISPNDADSHWTVAVTLRRLGRFDEALAHFEQAAALTPGLTTYAGGVLQTLLFTGRLDEAERERRNLLARYPTERWLEAARHTIRFLRSGDTAGWREAVNRIAPLTDASMAANITRRMLIGTGDLAGLIELYTGESAATAPCCADYTLGVTYTALGDGPRARSHLLAAASAGRASYGLEKAQGAVALALLGEPAEAVVVADEAVRDSPEARDRVNGPGVAMTRAWVLIKTQERAEEGYAEFERLLGAWDLSPRWVAALPEWRLLGNDPRVRQILRVAIAKQAATIS